MSESIRPTGLQSTKLYRHMLQILSFEPANTLLQNVNGTQLQVKATNQASVYLWSSIYDMEDFGKTSTSKEARLLCPWGTRNLYMGLAARETRTE